MSTDAAKSTESAESTDPKPAPVLGEGVRVERTLSLPQGDLPYEAVAKWTVLHEDDAPIASIFWTGYFAKGVDPSKRPITFLFNGGPGSASVWLHMGMVGPKRIAFADDGGLLPPPARLVDNPESWLAFTDVVCIDPVGTGFSRSHEPKGEGDTPAPSRFWEVERDLDSMGEVISRILSTEHRWLSPVSLAGESYGGFRVARLAKTLQEDHGVALNVAMLISPAIEMVGLLPTDYTIEHFIDLFPSLAASAHAHGRAGADVTEEAHRLAAETFAGTELVVLLARGTDLPHSERTAVCAKAARLLGLEAAQVERALGRIDRETFCRALLADQHRFVGRYDGTLTNADPFPDRSTYAGPDITLGGITAAFTAAINQHLRADLGVVTELRYNTINMKANLAWKDKAAPHFVAIAGQSMDELRYGMALNPHMKVLVTHGHHDLVTPYASSSRLRRMLKLGPDHQDQLVVENYRGGHMYYTHPGSRDAFTARVRQLVSS